MNAFKILVFLAAALVICLPVEGSGPIRVTHTPPPNPVMGQTLRVSVVLEGVPDGEPVVKLHCRGRGERAVTIQKMEPKGDGRYETILKPEKTRFLELAYHIEIEGPDGSYSLDLGSSQAPLVLSMREAPAETGSGALRIAAIFAGAVFFVSLLFWFYERKQKRRVLDQIFWVKTLVPICHLQGQDLSDAITRLTQAPLYHPTRGPQKYPRPFILCKLKEIRSKNLTSLLQRHDRRFSSPFSAEKRAPAPVRPDGAKIHPVRPAPAPEIHHVKSGPARELDQSTCSLH